MMWFKPYFFILVSRRSKITLDNIHQSNCSVDSFCTNRKCCLYIFLAVNKKCVGSHNDNGAKEENLFPLPFPPRILKETWKIHYKQFPIQLRNPEDKTVTWQLRLTMEREMTFLPIIEISDLMAYLETIPATEVTVETLFPILHD